MEKLGFDGQVVVVTGAAGSLGRAHAEFLARRGAKVLVNDVSVASGGSPAAQAVVDAIRDQGGEAEANTDSVASYEGAAALVGQALDSFGRLDAVVHSAAVFCRGPIEDFSFEEYERVRAVHLDGAFCMARASWPHMQRSGYGRVLFITSHAGIQGHPGCSPYGTAKAGQIGLMRCLAIEGRSYGIQVNALGNSAHNARLADGQHQREGGADVRQWSSSVLRPDLVSPVVGWLIHPSCDVTGELFYTGGGHIHREVWATTKGYTNRNLTIEDVAEHYPEIADEAGANIYAAGHDCQYAWFQQLVDSGAPPYPGPPGNPPLKTFA